MRLFRPGHAWSQKIVHAGFWAFTLHSAEQLAVLCRLLVLAVLLAPRDFGLFGIAILTTLAMDTFSRTGLEQALIQKKEEITPYLEVAWTVRLVRGVLLALLLFGAAPWVASFFGEPAAAALMRALSLSFLLRGLNNIGVVYFQKELEFHKEFAFRFSGTFVDMGVAITAACLLRNAWAFVLGYLAGDFARLAVSYWIQPFRPHLRFDSRKFRELFDYGMWVLFFSITVFVGNNGASLVIGKIIGATALGYYQMAVRIPDLVVRQLGITLHYVAFPVYAQLQGSAERLRTAYQGIGGFSAAVLIPAAAGIICVGQDFTRIFLGGKWAPMVPALLILSAAALLSAVPWTGRPVFMGGGRPQVVFHMQVATALTVFLCIYPLASRWEIGGAAVVMVLSQVAALFVWYLNIRRLLPVTGKDIALLFAPPLIASAAMTIAIYGLKALTLPLLPGGRLWQILWFVSLILVGVAVYVSMVLIFQRCLPDYQPLKGITRAMADEELPRGVTGPFANSFD